jgi:hypothetical protein
VIALFFMLGWDRYRFYKKRVRTRYTERLFFHPDRSAGHVIHSGTFGLRNVITLFFILGLDRYGFDEKHVETRYAELVFLHSV